MAGRFITFEGIEGAGKTTQILAVEAFLKNKGIQTLLTREPGGTEVSERIREIFLDKSLAAMHEDTELLLMFAARAEHLQKKILPALSNDIWVLCDRFTDASYAYQGFGRGIDLARLETLETWVQGELRPDLVFIFDLDVETGLARVGKRGEKDRMEEESRAFFTRVRQGYLQRAAEGRDGYKVINAANSMESVRHEIIQHLEQWFL